MADVKITALTAATALTTDDLFVVVDNPGGTPATKKITVANAATSLAAAVTTTWTAVTFANSWVDFGSGFQTVQYRKVDDVVELRGLMASGTIGAAAFTLPVGHRPPAIEMFAVASNAAFGAGYVSPTGEVIPTNGSNSWFSLMGIRFSVTA